MPTTTLENTMKPNWISFVLFFAASACGASELQMSMLTSSSVVDETVFAASATDCTAFGPSSFFGCNKVERTIATPTLATSDKTLLRTGREIRLKYIFQCGTAASVKGFLTDDTGRIYEVSSMKTTEERVVQYTSFNPTAALTLTLPAHTTQISNPCFFKVTYKLATPVVPVLSLYTDMLLAMRREIASLRAELNNDSHWSLVQFGINTSLTRLKADRTALETRAAAFPAGSDQRLVLDAKILQLNGVIADLEASKAGVATSCPNNGANCQSVITNTLSKMDSILSHTADERNRLISFLEAEIARLAQLDAALKAQVDAILASAKL